MKKRAFSFLLAMLMIAGTVMTAAPGFTVGAVVIAENDVVEDNSNDYVYNEASNLDEAEIKVELPVDVAGTHPTSGVCGDGVVWKFYTLNGILNISYTGSGSGEMYDYMDVPPWSIFNLSMTSCIINDGVTSIGDGAFYCCENLKNISIADSVKTIGDFAFFSCKKLESIDIPDNVTSIGEAAFALCYSLADIELPNSIITIGDGAFRGCSMLSEINLPDGLTAITKQLFYNCNLRSIEIPASVSHIDITAFDWCWSLSCVNVADNSPYYMSIDGVLFTKNLETLVYFPDEKITEGRRYDIPEGVKIIGEYSFSGAGLESIVLPNSVISIEKYAFSNIWCDSIVGADSLVKIGDYAFSGTQINSFEIPETVIEIGNGAFSGTGIKEISIPEGITKIGKNTFNGCYYLEKVNLPESLTSIEDGAFYWCTALTSIDIPDGVTEIGNSAFYSCKKLYNVEIPANVSVIGNHAFSCCASLTGLKFMGAAPIEVGYNAFSAHTIIYYNDGMQGWSSPVWNAPNGECYDAVVLSENHKLISGIVSTPVTEENAVITICVFDSEDNKIIDIETTDLEYFFELEQGYSFFLLPGEYTLKIEKTGCFVETRKITVSNEDIIVELIELTPLTYGECGDGVVWNFDDNTGVLSITYSGSGSGKMNDYEYLFAGGSDGPLPAYYTRPPWYSFANKINKCIVSAGVTGIGDWAFYGFAMNEAVFEGDAPTEWGRYAMSEGVTIYYKNGTKGWTTPEWTAHDGTVYSTAVMDKPTITVSNNIGRTGETVTVTVDMKNNPGFGGMAFDVKYDNAVLELVSYELGLGSAICTPSGIDTYADKMNFQYAGISNITGDGTLVTLTFKVKDNAEEGTTTISIVPEEGTFFKYDGRNEVDIEVLCIDGGVEIVNYIKGDINGDGKVNNRDAARLMQYLAGWDVESVEPALDVNGDGRVNNRDAARLMQYLAGWEVELS